MKLKVLRLRIGILLIILSWFPFAWIILFIAHNNGKWESEKTSQLVRAIVWLIQILVGLVGLWLVGQMAVQTAKKEGWKKAPGNMWRLFLHGLDKPEAPSRNDYA